MDERLKAEELILELADIVLENKRLRRELDETKARLKEREDYIVHMHQQTIEGQEMLFEAGLKGCFNTK